MKLGLQAQMLLIKPCQKEICVLITTVGILVVMAHVQTKLGYLHKLFAKFLNINSKSQTFILKVEKGYP